MFLFIPEVPLSHICGLLQTLIAYLQKNLDIFFYKQMNAINQVNPVRDGMNDYHVEGEKILIFDNWVGLS